MNSIEILRQLETEGKYVFHGTTNGKIISFEPRQAISHGEPDGEPCIAASRFVDPAVFMAIFSARVSCGWNSGNEGFGFYVNMSDYKRAQDESWIGYVYIFDREDFSLYLAWEWRAYANLTPLKKIKVSFGDLTKDIQFN